MAAAVDYDFDQDEKNEPVGFEQDPDSDDFGDGYFVYADGTRKYASDPEQADKLSAAGKTTAPGKPGEGTGNLAQGADEEIQPPADPGTRVSYAGDPSSPYANAVAANEGATGSAALGVQSPANQPSGAPPSSAEKAQIAPTADEKAKLGGQLPAPAAPPIGTPPAPVGPPAAPAAAPPIGAPASALPALQNKRGVKSEETANESQSQSLSDTESKSTSGSVSRTGSAMTQPQFEQQQGDVQKTYNEAIHGNQDAQQKLADLMAEHQAQMAQQGRDREVQTQAAIAQNEQRRKAATQKIQEIDSRPTDANKIWKDKGTLGTILGGLGVAMGSLYATRHGGPNTALEAIERQKQDSIKIQLADRDSELRGLERELGSLDAAVPVFEARMNGALSQQAQAMMTGEKSAQVRANGADLVAKLNTERQAKLAEGAKAYYGTIATQQAGQVGSNVTRGSTGTSTRGSNTGSDTEDVFADPKTPPKDRTEGQAKAQSAVDSLDAHARASGLVQDKNGDWVPGGKKAEQATVDATRESAVAALNGVGQKDADDVVGKDGSFFVPSWLSHAPSTPEELAAKLNARRRMLLPQLDRSDRDVSRNILKNPNVIGKRP